jgi:hypothetical protein
MPEVKDFSGEGDRTVYYPYNKTFKYYAEPRAGKRARAFIDESNKLKGGEWELHTSEQYSEWKRKKGDHLDYLKS